MGRNELKVPLKSLEQFQKERRADWNRVREFQQSHPNGIACPECGEELWDSNPSCTLTSNPPQKNIHCPNCNYRGFRIA